jgi:hypothetical protein
MLRSSIISSSADTLILTLFSLLHVCVCVCVLGMWGRSQCSSAAQSAIILRGAEAVSHSRSMYLPVLTSTCLPSRESKRKRDRKKERHAYLIHFMTPTCTIMPSSMLLRCLLSFVSSCLVLSVDHWLRIYFCYHCCSCYFLFFTAS